MIPSSLVQGTLWTGLWPSSEDRTEEVLCEYFFLFSSVAIATPDLEGEMLCEIEINKGFPNDVREQQRRRALASIN